VADADLNMLVTGLLDDLASVQTNGAGACVMDSSASRPRAWCCSTTKPGERGYKHLAVTDYSRGLTIARGLSSDDIEAQHREIDDLNEVLDGRLRVIKGIEANQDAPFALVHSALDAGCVFAIDSDAHDADQLVYAEIALAHARLAGVPSSRVINCWTTKKLLSWLDRD